MIVTAEPFKIISQRGHVPPLGAVAERFAVGLAIAMQGTLIALQNALADALSAQESAFLRSPVDKAFEAGATALDGFRAIIADS